MPQPNPNDESLASRALRAAQIVRSPRHYKVCESCESIVPREAHTCLNCRGYRFDTDPARVVSQAEILGNRLPNSIPRDLR